MASVPIDKGWSWFVLVGAFISTFFVIGGFKSAGILFVHVLEKFEASQSLTAWMLGLMSFGLALFAPFGTAMGMRCGYRYTVMLGGFVMSLGYLISAYAPNVYMVVCVLGGLVGLGNGLMYTPSMIMVGQYFNKQRSLAMGIAAAGGSCGSLVIPLIVRYLLDNYNYQGCMLIYSAVTLHAVLGGVLLRPQSFYKPKQIPVSEEELPEKDPVCLDGTPSNSMNSLVFKIRIQDSLTSTPVNAVDVSERARSLENIHETVLESGPMEKFGDPEKLSLTAHYNSNGSLQMVRKPCEDKQLSDKHSYQSSTGSLIISATENKDNMIDDKLSCLELYPIKEESGDCCAECCNDCCLPFKNMADKEVLYSLVFWLYFVAACIGNAGYIDQFVFMPPYAKELGIAPLHRATILSIAGVADLCGRVSGGLINNLKVIPIHIYISLTLFVAGVGIMITLLFPCYASLVAHAVILGSIGGMYIAMFPIMCVRLVGVAKFPAAFSLTMFGAGITNLPLPTIFGTISDIKGSYTIPYIVLNIMLLLAGVLFLLTQRAKTFDHQRMRKRKTEHVDDEKQPVDEQS